MGSFRPNIAYFQLNTDKIKFTKDVEEQKRTLYTIMEGITHILGFNPYSYKLFQDKDLNLIGIDRVASYETDANSNV